MKRTFLSALVGTGLLVTIFQSVSANAAVWSPDADLHIAGVPIFDSNNR